MVIKKNEIIWSHESSHFSSIDIKISRKKNLKKSKKIEVVEVKKNRVKVGNEKGIETRKEVTNQERGGKKG